MNTKGVGAGGAWEVSGYPMQNAPPKHYFEKK